MSATALRPELTELYDALMTTKARRRFSAEPVPDELVELILDAGVQAPSGGNIQPYHFLVVRDQAKRDALGELYRTGWDRQMAVLDRTRTPARSAESAASIDRIYTSAGRLAQNLAAVPVLIFVLAKRISMALADEEGPIDIGPVYASVYPAVQNMILAARAVGLGTVLTTVHRIYESDAREVCAIPDTYEIAAVLPVGHPIGSWGTGRRRSATAITSWDTFGESR